MHDSEITFKLKGWPGVIIVILFFALPLAANHYTYRYNPKLNELTQALQSDDPQSIGKALLESSKLTMGKGHKLIPYILPHLSDMRELPKELRQKKLASLQSVPGSILGLEPGREKVLSIGFTAALTLQNLVILDVENRRWVGGKSRARIVKYVIDKIGIDSDEFTLENGLWAVNQIHDERLVPFWFQCLKIESESIRISALSGLFYYIYDRTHGLFTWHPEKEINEHMLENLKLCFADDSEYIRMSASNIAEALNKAGLKIHKDN